MWRDLYLPLHGTLDPRRLGVPAIRANAINDSPLRRGARAGALQSYSPRGSQSVGRISSDVCWTKSWAGVVPALAEVGRKRRSSYRCGGGSDFILRGTRKIPNQWPATAIPEIKLRLLGERSAPIEASGRDGHWNQYRRPDCRPHGAFEYTAQNNFRVHSLHVRYNEAPSGLVRVVEWEGMCRD